MENRDNKKISTAELKESFNTVNRWHSLITAVVLLAILALFVLFSGPDHEKRPLKNAVPVVEKR